MGMFDAKKVIENKNRIESETPAQWLLSPEQLKEIEHEDHVGLPDEAFHLTLTKQVAQAQLDHLIKLQWVSDDEHQETLQAHEYLIRKEYEGWKSPQEWEALVNNKFDTVSKAVDIAIQAEHKQTLKAVGRFNSPKVVCLCGSTRFKQDFIQANFDFTMKGYIVLTVGWFSHFDGQIFMPTPEQKLSLDELHKRKIDMADEVFIINKNGYIGESTHSEIEYAKAHNKPITYLKSDQELEGMG